MKYCNCQKWYDEEINEISVFNWEVLRKGNFCPFCGKPLIDSKDCKK